MAAEKTLAYVVRTRDYRDTSLLAVLFTAAFGKIQAVIKGGRDGRGRMDSSFEPFSLNEIMVYRRRRGDLHMVTNADLVERFDDLRNDLERLGTAAYFMELLDQMMGAEAHPEVFELIGEAFAFLGEGHSPRRTARIFEIKLMSALGFMPELGRCVRCGKPEPLEYYFSAHSGGIVCMDCRAVEAPLIIVPKGAVAFLDQARRRPFGELAAVKVSREVGEKLEVMMRLFLEQHLDYQPRSLAFLRKVGV